MIDTLNPRPAFAPLDLARPHDCYVPEGWEGIDRGMCPVCGTPVTWDAEAERWVTFDGAFVLVLTGPELLALINPHDPEYGWTPVYGGPGGDAGEPPRAQVGWTHDALGMVADQHDLQYAG